MTATESKFQKDRKLLMTLARNDFKAKFAGSYLGVIWAFVQPLVTVFIYWFVFGVALKASNGSGYPYIVWIVAGLVPWFYFSDAWNAGTSAMVSYDYLVKKVVFNINILPMVKLVSTLFINLFFLLIGFVLSCLYGFVPGLHTLQIFYYLTGLILLVIGLVYFTAAVAVFFRDMIQIVGIALQIGIWATPIMWNCGETLAAWPWLIRLFKLNPMYYIVDGYRDALLTGTWFFEKGWWTLYFWCFTLGMLWIGTRVFKKLKVHFADVL